MDTRNDDGLWPPARTAGARGQRRKTSLGSGSIAFAVVAIVGVVVAGIWTLAPSEGAPAASGSPAPSMSATPARVEREDARWTIYLWDPSSGEGGVVWRAAGQPTPADATPADAELDERGKRLVFASQWTDGLSQIFVRLPGGLPQRLTDLGGGAFEPTWSPDGSRIAFSGRLREGTDTDIFVMNADGSDLRRWFGTPRDDGHPDWSPGGSQIAFHARYVNRDTPSGVIWLASVRTGALTKLPSKHPEFGAVDPAWSPDGRWIAYSRFHRSMLNGRVWKPEIWRMRSDGTGRSRVGRPGSGTHSANDPSWSPDGRFIVFGRDEGIDIIDPRIEPEGHVVASLAADPSWSRRGILMITHGEPPEHPPDALAGLEFDDGIDATITMKGPTCALDLTHDPLRPGKLTLEFVNTSRLDGRFTMIRMNPGQTLADIEADPAWVWLRMGSHNVRDVDASWTDTWSRRVEGGDRWAVACWRYSPATNDPTLNGETVGFTVATAGGS